MEIDQGVSDVTVSAPGADCWHIDGDTHAQVGVGRHCGGVAAHPADVPCRPMMIWQYCWLIWQKTPVAHWKQSAETPVQVVPAVSIPPSFPPEPPVAPSWPAELLLQEWAHAVRQSSNANK